MQHNVELPQVELNMESVEVARCMVAVGDQVEAEQTILEVETQKAVVEVPCPVAGYIRKLFVKDGDTIGEKALLCIITDSADEAFTDPSDPNGASAKSASSSDHADTPCGLSTAHQVAAAEEAVPAIDPAEGKVRATPLARKVARELGVALNTVQGSGPSGRIKGADVRASAGQVFDLSQLQKQVAPASSAALPITGSGWTKLPASRLALIQQMQRALAEIPQFNLTRQMDVTPLLVRKEGITFTHRLIVALGAALVKHPALRTQIRGNQVRTEPVAVAVAMDTPHGLLAPVIRATDSLSLDQVAQALNALILKARQNALKREDLSDGPFALTNLGMFGVDVFDPFVFHGQTAVLGIGRAMEVAAGRRAAAFTLAVDHRVVDGAEAARFLQTLQQEILRP